MGIGLWLGLLSLASCAPLSNPYGAGSPGSATMGSGAGSYSSSSSSYGSGSYGSSSYASSGASSNWTSSGTQYHFSNSDPIDDSESHALTDYLHNNRLPLVGARVLAYSGSGPHKAILYGFVATPFGKNDAVAKTRRFLNDPNTEVDNRIMIKPELAASTPSSSSSSGAAIGSSSSSSSSTPGDIQAYQQQQKLAEQQQQQYMMNQGSSSSSGLMSLLPLLGLFGAFGAGSTGFGFGGGSFGAYPGFGAYGGYPAYPMGPIYPAPGYYGSPYSPIFPQGFSPRVQGSLKRSPRKTWRTASLFTISRGFPSNRILPEWIT
jgi:hypothetical protein